MIGKKSTQKIRNIYGKMQIDQSWRLFANSDNDWKGKYKIPKEITINISKRTN